MDGSLSSCQLRGRTPTHRRPTAFPLQTLQVAPPRLGSSRKSQREASDSSETPATTCGPEHGEALIILSWSPKSYYGLPWWLGGKKICLEPVLRNKRSYHNEKTTHRN